MTASLRRPPRSRSVAMTLPDNHLLSRHQAFIRALPCVACCKSAPSECAHIGIPAGLSLSPSERDLVPLCGPATIWGDCCHSRKWFLGAARFWSGLGIDPLDLAYRLWRVSGDVRAGERAIREARQRIITVRRYRSGANGPIPSRRSAAPSPYATPSPIRRAGDDPDYAGPAPLMPLECA